MLNEKKLFLDSVIEKSYDDKEDYEDKLWIEGLASTSSLDRHGDVITLAAWKNGVDRYKRNPILLYNHDYDKPIGKCESVEVRSEGLWVKGWVSKAAGNIAELIKEGILKTFSVGFLVKDLDYQSETDGFVIKDAELLEISVVTVPANADAEFSLAKQLDKLRDELREEAQKKAMNSQEQDAAESEIQMTQEEIQKMIEDAAAKAAQKREEELTAAQKAAEEKAAAEKAAEEKAAAEKAEREELVKQVVEVSAHNSQKLIEDLEKRFEEKWGKVDTVEEIVGDLKGQLEQHGPQITADRERKRLFASRNETDAFEKFGKDLEDVWLLSRATANPKKGIHVNYETDYAKQVFQKVNEHSGIDVSSGSFEEIVSTRIERDIQNMLVLAPLFREIQMNSATQLLPILPDAGYAEFTGNPTASGSAPRGNLATRGDAYGSPYTGVTLEERQLSTKKLISRTYLGNETEEDAILPILPLLRESMVRSHARAVEAAILVGNHVDGPFGTGGASFQGLIGMADADGNEEQMSGTFANFGGVTASMLLGARKNMGKYGVNQRDVVYLVNQQGWFELLEDPEFQDVNLVGDMATKLTGEVGRIFGSPVLLVDEFAAPAADKFFAAAVNPMNYVVPRLRGVTVESDYETADQRTVLVASQRLGFIDIIDGASSVWALQYPSAT